MKILYQKAGFSFKACRPMTCILCDDPSGPETGHSLGGFLSCDVVVVAV